MYPLQERKSPELAARARGGEPVLARGFTLIELLVVIAIVVLLVSLLLPALSSARQVARTAACGSNLAQQARGLQAYTATYRDFLPGPNTSGFSALAEVQGQSFAGGVSGDRNGMTPVAANDWLTPIIGDSLNLPTNRAERFRALLDPSIAGSPAMELRTDIVQEFPVEGPDMADFHAIQASRGFSAPSYLSPAAFHAYPVPRTVQGVELKSLASKRSVGDGSPPFVPALIPDNYAPRIDLVGTVTSGKIFSANGVRMMFRDGGGSLRVWVDVSRSPALWGAFLSTPAVSAESWEYGGDFNPSGGAQNRYSFPHNNSLQASHFDGHVKLYRRRDAVGDASLWYPSGSTWVGNGSGSPEANARYSAGDILN